MVDEGVQLHGGWGYMWEYPICRMYANARIQRIFAGTSEIMKEIISRGMKPDATAMSPRGGRIGCSAGDPDQCPATQRREHERPVVIVESAGFLDPAAGAVRLAAAGRHGADVLRVESPGRMDLVRVLPPHVDGTSASHAYLNRNKRSIGLDLKRQGAREVVLELVREYDIVLEQFRPG